MPTSRRASRRLASLCMPPERTPKTLEDIRDAASFVLAVTEEKELKDYSADRLLRQAIGRNFETIGEAVGRLVRDDPDTILRLSEHRREGSSPP